MRRRGLMVLLLAVAFLAGWLAHALLRDAVVSPPPQSGSTPSTASPSDDSLRAEVARLRVRVQEMEASTGRQSEGSPGASTEVAPAPKTPPQAEDGVNGTLRVRVVEFSGRAVQGVSIRLMRGAPNTPARSANTDSDGTAEFPDLPSGEWHLEAEFGEGKLGTTATVFAGRVSEVSLVHPARGVPVEGTIRDSAGSPREGVTVTLTSMEAGAYVNLSTKSDASGNYRFEGVRPGGWNVSLSTNSSESGVSQANRLFIPPGETFHKDFLAGPVLRGTVRDRTTGALLAGVQVQCQRQGNYLDSVTTDSDGSFEFKGLKPGTFELMLSRSGYGFTLVRNVEAPEGGTSVDLEMSPAARLRLHVTDPEGRPVAGDVFIGISPKAEGQGTSVGTSFQADAEGRASYDQILPGTYVLRFIVKKVGECQVEVTLAPGENTLEVRLEPK